MRRKISLYIADTLVDLDDESLVLFNYTQEDLDNPTIVKNSFSQQITLQRTANNNQIFDHAFRLDRVSGSAFNPRVKTPFVIYNELNEILESGYCKLDSVSDVYSVSLYGGLGQFLYGLSYRADGEPLSLADLDFLETQDPASEFDYTINRTLVANAWSVLAGEQQNDLFETINFAPCYNGIPSKDFAADKAVFNGSLYGQSGILQADLAKAYTEREMQDMRSYLQRPVIRFRKIIEAIQRFATDLGYTFALGGWDDDDNPYWESLWMTLPILKDTRSGDTITKAQLLSSTSSPASYLLAYCKMFGLKLICADKLITLEERDEFFRDNVIDLSKRIEVSESPNLTPFIMDSKWYEMMSEVKGEFADYYATAYNRTYGNQKINTGYEFSNDVKQLMDTLVFKGAVQSMEKSETFRNAYKEIGSSSVDFPAAFLDGGSYKVESAGETTEYPLASGKLSFQWWNTTDNGYDIGDLPQFHEADNKEIDGNNVLLFFNSMVECPSQMKLSDDISEMGETPCWNLTNSGTRVLLEIPQFSRFIVTNGVVSKSLEWGNVAEFNILDIAYSASSGNIYRDRWKTYLEDRYNENTKMVRVKVNLAGMQVGNDLLRSFYWFGGSVWALNRIINYSLTTYDPVECEFVQVQDIENYLNGQTI